MMLRDSETQGPQYQILKSSASLAEDILARYNIAALIGTNSLLMYALLQLKIYRLTPNENELKALQSYGGVIYCSLVYATADKYHCNCLYQGASCERSSNKQCLCFEDFEKI